MDRNFSQILRLWLDFSKFDHSAFWFLFTVDANTYVLLLKSKYSYTVVLLPLLLSTSSTTGRLFMIFSSFSNMSDNCPKLEHIAYLFNRKTSNFLWRGPSNPKYIHVRLPQPQENAECNQTLDDRRRLHRRGKVTN